jgi:hypothetical protein
MGITAEVDQHLVNELLLKQFGVVSRDQLLQRGKTRSAIQYLTRPNGPWRKLLPGIYAADAHITKERREMAAQLHAGPAGVITSGYAVRLFGLQASGPTAVEVLVPPEVRRMSSGFVRLIRTTRMPETVYRMGPIRFAGPVRSIADAVRGYSDISDARAVVCAAIKREVCSLAEFATELAEGPSRGSLLLRRSLRDAAQGIWSAAEGDLMDLIRASDLEQPEFNVALYAEDGTLLGVVDAWWQCAGVAAEVDSREFHFDKEDWEDTLDRHNRITASLVHLMHFTPRTIKTNGSSVLDKLRLAISQGSRNPALPIRAEPQRANGAFGTLQCPHSAP